MKRNYLPRYAASMLITALVTVACEHSAQPFTDAPPPPPPSQMPAIALDPSTIAIMDSVGRADPQSVGVAVSNSGMGALRSLTVQPTIYEGGASWLTASLTADSAPATLTITTNGAGLTPGTYIATVPIAAAGASNSPQRVQVTLTVAGP
ncbi:MAG TPA: hypothetical protein VGI92_02760 [Gemmatimonadales bacterium]|jgi:hypothetical protein